MGPAPSGTTTHLRPVLSSHTWRVLDEERQSYLVSAEWLEEHDFTTNDISTQRKLDLISTLWAYQARGHDRLE